MSQSRRYYLLWFEIHLLQNPEIPFPGISQIPGVTTQFKFHKLGHKEDVAY